MVRLHPAYLVLTLAAIVVFMVVAFVLIELRIIPFFA